MASARGHPAGARGTLPLAAASTRNGTSLDALSERLKQLAHNGPFDEDTRLGRWWAVAVHTARDLYRGNVLDWAASMAFYSGSRFSH
jgi:hypothetical protein